MCLRIYLTGIIFGGGYLQWVSHGIFIYIIIIADTAADFPATYLKSRPDSGCESRVVLHALLTAHGRLARLLVRDRTNRYRFDLAPTDTRRLNDN